MSYAESFPTGPFTAGPRSPGRPGGHRHPHGMRGMRARWMAMIDSDGPSENSGENPEESSGGRPADDRRGGPHRHGRPGPWGGRGPWGPPRGRRRERGDVRAAVLLLLAERPRHGYEILTELSDRSDGQWQPSPGSVYPVLKRLARDGIVEAAQEDGKRIFSLTDQGRALVAAEGASWGEPWAGAVEDEGVVELWGELRLLMAAAKQVGQLNDPEQVAAAAAAITAARKQIYALLAQ